MAFDPGSFVRLDSPQSLGASASGASFATSTGDILEVSCYGPGIFRLRAGPNTRPDYGLIQGKTRACTVAHEQDRRYTFAAGDALLEIAEAPLRFRLLHRGHPVFESITDEHFRGWTRLPTFGRVRQGGQWIASFALASGEAVYGLGEKFGPLDKRGQLIHSQVVDALGVNTGAAYKNVPFAWSPGKGHGAWGVFVHTPGMVTHGVGHPDWSHRSYAVLVDDEALDLFVFAADTPAEILARYTELTGRAPPVPLWGLGLWVSRAYYETPEEAADGGGDAARAEDPVRRADARRPRRVEGGDAIRFRMGRGALPRSLRSAGADQGAPAARLRLGISVRLDPLAAVRGARRPALSAQARRTAAPTSSAGTRRRRRAPSAAC